MWVKKLVGVASRDTADVSTNLGLQKNLKMEEKRGVNATKMF